MTDNARDFVCLITHGIDQEMSSVGFTIANGGITAGFFEGDAETELGPAIGSIAVEALFV